MMNDKKAETQKKYKWRNGAVFTGVNISGEISYIHLLGVIYQHCRWREGSRAGHGAVRERADVLMLGCVAGVTTGITGKWWSV